MSDALAALLETYIERYHESGERPDLTDLCGAAAERGQLAELVSRFHDAEALLRHPRECDPVRTAIVPVKPPPGFELIECIGEGAFGSVYKARDTRLQRIVAIKFVLRELSGEPGEDILREARFLAALADPVIPAVHAVFPEYRAIVTEFVAGFDPRLTAANLELRQLASLMRRLGVALGKAHRGGFVHRDLKPGNIKLDEALQPKLLDFGLSRHLGAPDHGWGSGPYAAPEQFKGDPIDGRTDLYGLGAVFYELACGAPPFQATESVSLSQTIACQPPILPREYRADLPQGFQAIILKCLEKDPELRYQSATELVQDLDRFLEGREVQARPTLYASTLEHHVRSHLDDLDHWHRTGLIFPHERHRLAWTYHKLLSPQQDWIPENRLLTYDQLALYLGVAVLFFGAGCLFYAHHWLAVTRHWLYPAGLLGLTLAGLYRLARRPRARVASVAFEVAVITLLPLWLLTCLRACGWLALQPATDLRLLPSGLFSNAQIQTTALAVLLYAVWRARLTRAFALGTLAVLAGILLYLALLANLGLRLWLDDSSFYRLGTHLFPLVAILALGARLAERRALGFLAQPAYYAMSVVLILALELSALQGHALGLLGLGSRAPDQAPEGYDPVFFDTAVAMIANGFLIYLTARLLARATSPLLRGQGSWLYQVTPFLILEPLALLVSPDLYGVFYHWLYLAASLAVLVLSEVLQRKSFAYAGIANGIIALGFITSHYQWLEHRFWPFLLIACGLILLLLGRAMAGTGTRN